VEVTTCHEEMEPVPREWDHAQDGVPATAPVTTCRDSRIQDPARDLVEAAAAASAAAGVAGKEWLIVSVDVGRTVRNGAILAQTAAPDVLAALKAKITWLEDELSRVRQFLAEHTSATTVNQESQDT